MSKYELVFISPTVKEPSRKEIFEMHPDVVNFISEEFKENENAFVISEVDKAYVNANGVLFLNPTQFIKTFGEFKSAILEYKKTGDLKTPISGFVKQLSGAKYGSQGKYKETGE